jgi:hypothetical protein
MQHKEQQKSNDSVGRQCQTNNILRVALCDKTILQQNYTKTSCTHLSNSNTEFSLKWLFYQYE